MQETYSIPRQTIDLTTGNIAYVAPEFELSPESGMPKNYVASADVSLSDIVNFREEGNKHILTLETDTVVFEYPSSEQKKAGKLRYELYGKRR